MLNAIINNLNAKLELTGYFQENFGITKLIAKETSTGTNSFPAEYNTNGGYKTEIQNITNYDGLSYWRLSGDVVTADSSAESYVSCDDLIDITYPLQLIIAIPKKKLSFDDQFSSFRVITSLTKQLTDNNAQLKSLINARRVDINVGNSTDDSVVIMAQEFTNISRKDISYKHVHIMMNINIVVTIRKSCIIPECDMDSDILHIFNFCDPDVINRLTAEQLACIDENICEGITPLGIYHRRPFLTGQLLIARPGGDGDNRANGVYTYVGPTNPIHVTEFDNSVSQPWFTLLKDNIFGNRTRFTNIAGDYFRPGCANSTYVNGDLFNKDGVVIPALNITAAIALFGTYTIDNLTGLGWHNEVQSSDNWNNQIDNGNSAVLDTFSDWRLANLSEYNSIMWQAADGTDLIFEYCPMNIGQSTRFWTSTTQAKDPTKAFYIDERNLPGNLGTTFAVAKTNNFAGILVRNHFN